VSPDNQVEKRKPCLIRQLFFKFDDGHAVVDFDQQISLARVNLPPKKMDPRGPISHRAAEPLAQFGAEGSDEGTQSTRRHSNLHCTYATNFNAVTGYASATYLDVATLC
jgi:hypothetical protein